jgi:membrane protein
MNLDRAVRRIDRAQQRWPGASFVFAVLRKYGEDQAGSLAALIAYYAFLSVFPLLLVFVTILGLLLPSHPGLQNRLLTSALAEFPVIGDQLRLAGLHGDWWVLVVGIAISVWGARGVANAAQYAFNEVWDVPYAQRPGFLPGLGRSLGMLLLLGLAVVVTGALSGVGGTGVLAVPARVGVFAVSTAVNVGVFILAFRLATAPVVATRCLILGAVVSALLWQALLATGGLLVTHQVRHAQSLYGLFGVVLGLVGWLQIQAQLTLLAIEIDVVRARRLWPRSAVPPPLTEADRDAYTAYARSARRLPEDQQDIDVRFPPEAEGRRPEAEGLQPEEEGLPPGEQASHR